MILKRNVINIYIDNIESKEIIDMIIQKAIDELCTHIYAY